MRKATTIEGNLKGSGIVAPGVSKYTVPAFDKLETAVQQQTVAVGTKLTALNLPATLAATGYTAVADTKVGRQRHSVRCHHPCCNQH